MTESEIRALFHALILFYALYGFLSVLIDLF